MKTPPPEIPLWRFSPAEYALRPKSRIHKKPLLLLPPSPPDDVSDADEDMIAAVAEVEALLGYTFLDPSILEEALIHPSAAGDGRSYQRLEFVGDAALGLAVTNYFFLTNPGFGPGALSSLRAANISTEKLARVAVRHGLYGFLRRNSPSLDQMVEEFTAAVMREIEEDFEGLPFGGSTVKAPKVLADIVESIAAAVYVDCNFNLETLWTVFRGLLEPIITSETWDEQPVTALYELCQKQRKDVKFIYWRKGCTVITNVFVDGKLLGSGSSEQNLIAKLNAARDALEKLSKEQPVEMEVKSLDNIGASEEDGAKQRLHELCDKKRWQKPVYKTEKEQGPAHNRIFTCSVRVVTANDTFFVVGGARSRVKDAENSAASDVLSVIRKQSQC